MSAPSSVEELLQLIRKSGVVDEQRLSAYLLHRELTRGQPTSPREVINELLQEGIVTNFQSEQFMLGKWRGFTIGKYKLLERVGVGGMGQVFLCEHMFMKRRVAVKVLPPEKADKPAALGRFYREARAAGCLEHPNIVRTHDIDQDGNLHYIVMDYIEGSNLLDVVKKFGALELGRTISYVRQIAIGLDYAFRNSIIHRDIKPGNILIDRQGVARILDMGLARFINDHTDLLTLKYDDKIVLGTADYVAPEQIANSHAVDIRADIYALGSTLYFLLAGHPPFPSGTVSQKLLWHRSKDPTPIRQVRPEVPEGLAAIVEKMMAKDPKARYQTPMQVVVELEPFLTEPVSLPREAEMPVLSRAASECASLESPVPAAIGAMGGSKSSTAVLSPPQTKNPFGASASVPWDNSAGPTVIAGVHRNTPAAPLAGLKPSSRPTMQPLPPAPLSPASPSSQTDAETKTGAGGPARRSNRFFRAILFGDQAGDAQDSSGVKKLLWVLVIVAFVATLGVLVAVLTQ